MSYHAPVKDMLFCMEELAGLEQLSRLPGFELETIWYLSAAGVIAQMFANLMLLQREFRARLMLTPGGQDHPSSA